MKVILDDILDVLQFTHGFMVGRKTGKYYEPIITALEQAGYECGRVCKNSHILMKAPDDPNVARKIARVAGLEIAFNAPR